MQRHLIELTQGSGLLRQRYIGEWLLLPPLLVLLGIGNRASHRDPVCFCEVRRLPNLEVRRTMMQAVQSQALKGSWRVRDFAQRSGVEGRIRRWELWDSDAGLPPLVGPPRFGEDPTRTQL